jgi:8-oxo-dGTP diphosphatase
MIDVTCAIIRREGKILAAQRGKDVHLAGQWEFPGGKVNLEESEEACIVREIQEELGIEVLPVRRLSDSIHDYGDKQIRLIPFECDLLKGEPIAKEHAALAWFHPKDMASLDWCEADLPIVDEIVSSG